MTDLGAEHDQLQWRNGAVCLCARRLGDGACGSNLVRLTDAAGKGMNVTFDLMSRRTGNIFPDGLLRVC